MIVEVAEMVRKLSHEEFLAWLQQREDGGATCAHPGEVDADLRAERESWDD